MDRQQNISMCSAVCSGWLRLAKAVELIGDDFMYIHKARAGLEVTIDLIFGSISPTYVDRYHHR